MSNWFVFNKTDDEELLIDKSEDKNGTDQTNSFFQDLPKNKVWNDISTKVVKSVDEYKKRWKNIRDTYLFRNQNKETTESAELKTRMKWSMANRASFIRTVYNLNDIEEELEGSNVPFLKPKE